MKQCPQCGNTYTDDALRYCLADGAVLTESADGDTTAPTQMLRTGGENVRIDIPETVTVAAARPEAKATGNALKWIVGTLAAMFVLLLVIGAVGGGVYYIMRSQNGNQIATSSPTPTPERTPDERDSSPTPTATPTQTPKPTETPLPDDNDEKRRPDTIDDAMRATVISPGDGFLALRSEPSIDRGERIMKIPDGAVVMLISCEDDRVSIGGKSGRWCLVEYGNASGWAFDVYLKY